MNDQMPSRLRQIAETYSGFRVKLSKAGQVAYSARIRRMQRSMIAALFKSTSSGGVGIENFFATFL